MQYDYNTILTLYKVVNTLRKTEQLLIPLKGKSR